MLHFVCFLEMKVFLNCSILCRIHLSRMLKKKRGVRERHVRFKGKKKKLMFRSDINKNNTHKKWNMMILRCKERENCHVYFYYITAPLISLSQDLIVVVVCMYEHKHQHIEIQHRIFFPSTHSLNVTAVFLSLPLENVYGRN